MQFRLIRYPTDFDQMQAKVRYLTHVGPAFPFTLHEQSRASTFVPTGWSKNITKSPILRPHSPNESRGAIPFTAARNRLIPPPAPQVKRRISKHGCGR